MQPALLTKAAFGSVPADPVHPSLHLRASLSLPVRIMLHLTTRRWAPSRHDFPLVEAALFEPFERAGWTIRVASPRNFMLWRSSRALRDSAAALVVLPDCACGLGSTAHTLLCMQEFLRRIAKQALVLRGLPADLSESPDMLGHLRREALARVLPDASADAADPLFAQIEAMLGEHMVGFRRPTRSTAPPSVVRGNEYPTPFVGFFF